MLTMEGPCITWKTKGTAAKDFASNCNRLHDSGPSVRQSTERTGFVAFLFGFVLSIYGILIPSAHGIKVTALNTGYIRNNSQISAPGYLFSFNDFVGDIRDVNITVLDASGGGYFWLLRVRDPLDVNFRRSNVFNGETLTYKDMSENDRHRFYRATSARTGGTR